MKKTIWGIEDLDEDEFEEISYSKDKTIKRLRLARKLFKRLEGKIKNV